MKPTRPKTKRPTKVKEDGYELERKEDRKRVID
jgi:hypothetical protein